MSENFQAKLQDPTWWRERCLNDLYFLNRVVLCTLEDTTPGFKDLWKPTHKRICDFVTQWGLPGHKVMIFCPRGWVKSYLVTIGWSIQKLLRNLVAGKRDHWIISNATFGNAAQFLKKIKYNLQYNDLLRGIFADVLPEFPDTEAERWTMEEIELKGNTIEIGSVEGNLVSRHYRGMLNDDLVNLENSKTSDQIDKVKDWWKLAQSLLEADGQEIMLGTRWRFNDLYGWLLEEFLQIPKETEDEFRFKPVVEWHRENYHYLRYLCWDDPIREKGSTFPTLFSEKRLHQIKREQGEHFGGQYLNDPLSLTDAPFHRKWFRYWREADIPAQRITLQLMDPAGKETNKSDFTGQVVFDAGVDRKIYIREAEKRKETDLRAVEWLVLTAVHYQSDMIGVEDYRFSVFRELADFLIPQMIRQGKIPEHLHDYARRIPYRMVELKHHSRPKQLRIRALTGWYERGDILHAPRGMGVLENQLLRFTGSDSDEDDIIDAEAYGLDIVLFPSPKEEGKHLILPESLKKTAIEREKEEWESAADAAYLHQMSVLSDEDGVY